MVFVACCFARYFVAVTLFLHFGSGMNVAVHGWVVGFQQAMALSNVTTLSSPALSGVEICNIDE